MHPPDPPPLPWRCLFPLPSPLSSVAVPSWGPVGSPKGDPEDAKAAGGPSALPAPVPPVSRCGSRGRSHHCLGSRELACLG